MARQNSSKRSRSSDQANWFSQATVAIGWGVGLVILAVVGTIYLGQASQTALAGRNAQLLEGELDEVRQENAVLEQSIAESQSLETVVTRAEALGLQFEQPDPAEIEYIDVVVAPPAATAAPLPAAVRQAPDSIGEALWLVARNSMNQFSQGESRGE